MSDEEKKSSPSKPSDSDQEKPKPKRRASVRRKKPAAPKAKKSDEATVGNAEVSPVAEKAASVEVPAVEKKPVQSEHEQKTKESNSKPKPPAKPKVDEGKPEVKPISPQRPQRQPHRRVAFGAFGEKWA